MTQKYVAPLPNEIEMHVNREHMIYSVDGIFYLSLRRAKCSIQGSMGQHHHCRGDAVMYTRDAVSAKFYCNKLGGWDKCCINNTVMRGVASRCLGRVFRDGVCARHIDHLPSEEKKPPAKRRRWDRCLIKGCTTFLSNGWSLCKAWHTKGS